MEHINRVCDAFEAAWLAGQRPQIEPYLEDAPEPVRAALLYELLLLDLTYRRQGGETPTAGEYLPRFPERADLIGISFRKMAGPAEGAETAAVQAPEPKTEEKTTLPPPTPATGWPTIPGYTIRSEFPRSGMGVVYKACQECLNRTVALKMIRHGPSPDEVDLARFQNEAEAVACLHHPHIVPIFDFGRWNDLPYFTMEFMAGGTLAQRLGGEPLPPREAAQLVQTLARTMGYVHQQQIVHRDLKPANVLLTPDGTLKIADFGLAKFLDQDRGLTATRTVMGTASYMAPEQAAGRTREVGPPTDIYALGAILYETLTGRPPFRAETRELTIIQVLTEEPVPPTRWQADIPADLEAICLKCLDKEPGRRYATALELADDLQRFLAGEPVSAATVDDWEWQARCALRAGYEVLDLLKCGLTGNVYKARQMSLNRTVALKMIPLRTQGDADALARFRREAEVIAQLQHPNIVQVYDLGEQKGQPYFAMEFVDGGSLADKCGDRPLPTWEAAQLIETLARTTHYAHRQGIVHCGLKPTTVLLTAQGIPKVASFGLARLARLLNEDWERTEVWRAARGLSRCLAPEQAEGKLEAVRPATDVYAQGAILYKLLTGQPPFLAETVQGLLEQIRTQEPVPPSRLQPGVPADLADICLRCLVKEPGGRYRDAEALAEDLRRLLAGEPIAPLPLGPWGRMLKWVKRRWRKPD
jgi:serine/threonine protein kinase